MLPDIVCIDLIASAYPGKQVERLSNRGAITGHSVTCSVSVITNMTVSEQNLKLRMRNEHRRKTWYSSHSPGLILQSCNCGV